jgi:hypothetical protein
MRSLFGLDWSYEQGYKRHCCKSRDRPARPVSAGFLLPRINRRKCASSHSQASREQSPGLFVPREAMTEQELGELVRLLQALSPLERLSNMEARTVFELMQQRGYKIVIKPETSNE